MPVDKEGKQESLVD